MLERESTHVVSRLEPQVLDTHLGEELLHESCEEKSTTRGQRSDEEEGKQDH